jgi:hypothetical protein
MSRIFIVRDARTGEQNEVDFNLPVLLSPAEIAARGPAVGHITGQLEDERYLQFVLPFLAESDLDALLLTNRQLFVHLQHNAIWLRAPSAAWVLHNPQRPLLLTIRAVLSHKWMVRECAAVWERIALHIGREALQRGATVCDVHAAAAALGRPLPPALIASLVRHDGQASVDGFGLTSLASSATALDGHRLLGCAEIPAATADVISRLRTMLPAPSMGRATGVIKSTGAPSVPHHQSRRNADLSLDLTVEAAVAVSEGAAFGAARAPQLVIDGKTSAVFTLHGTTVTWAARDWIEWLRHTLD